MTRHQPEFEHADVPAGQGSMGLLLVVLNRWPLILLGVVVGLVLAGLYFVRQRPIYQASAQVWVIKKQPEGLPIQGFESPFSMIEDYLATHITLLRSQLIVSRAVQKGELKSLRTFAGMADPTGAILGSLTAAREASGTSGSSSVLNLSYRGPYPDECPVILMTVIGSYKDFLDETYRRERNDTLELIIGAEKQIQEDLTKSTRALDELGQTNPYVPTPPEGGGAVAADRVQSVEAEQSALVMRWAKLKDRLKAIEVARKDGRDPTPLLEVPRDAAATASAAPDQEKANTELETQLVSLRFQEKQLLANYGPDHPEVQSVRDRLSLTRELLQNRAEKPEPAKDAKRPASPAEVDAFVQTLAQQLANLELDLKTVSALNREQRKGVDLRENISHSRRMLEDIRKRLKEVNLIKTGGYEASVISPPGAGSQIEPKAMPIFLAGLFGGLLAGCGLVWLAEVTDKSFRTPEEIRRRLGMQIVGHLPPIKGDVAAAADVPADRALLDPSICTYYQPKSVQAEAFRGIRTTLHFSAQSEGYKLIQITSPNMGDGKTTLAANLAVSIAQSGKPVLLLDADFRRPRLHKMFGLSAQTGLASVIAGDAELDDAILPCPVVPHLSVLPCGPRPHNPAELLSTHRFRELLEVLKERFHFVLLDTPPLLAVSDPAVVAPQIDAVLLTVRVCKNGRPAAERAKEILNSLGARVLGVVVNGVGPRGQAGYGATAYSYRYHYNYAYPYEADENKSYYHADEGAKDEGPGASKDKEKSQAVPPSSLAPSSWLKRWFGG